MCAAEHQHVDIGRRQPGNRQRFLDRLDRLAAGSLATGQPLLLHRGQQVVVAEQGGGAVMRRGMDRKDMHREQEPALFGLGSQPLT